MSNIKSIAILITAYNRKEITIKCLRNLYDLDADDFKLDIYLVEDGCTDGTPEEISKLFPEVNLIQGDGNLFWNGGMRLAWKTASKKQYDFFLWLNDDTILYKNAIIELLHSYQNLVVDNKKPVVVVGVTKDPEVNIITYGGYKLLSRSRFRLSSLIEVNEELQECDVFNGNIVLVPNEIWTKVGNISRLFKHSIGDIEYGLRLRRNGYKAFITKKYVGECARNELQNKSKENLSNRFRELYSPKNHPKYFASFLWKYYPLDLLPYLLKLHIRVLFPK